MSTKRTRQQKQDYWKMLQEAMGIEPKDVDGQYSYDTLYYKQQIISIIKGRFDVKCPEWWDIDFMLDQLILNGRFYVSDSPSGIAPFDGSRYGLNMFNRSNAVTITNPVLATFRRWLAFAGSTKTNQAVMVYLYDNLNCYSFVPLINHYAYKLASLDCSLDVGIMNSRVAFIFNAEDSKQAEEAKLIYSQISKGKPAIFTKVKDALTPDSKGLEVQAFPVKENMVLAELIDAKRAIISDLMVELGINTTPYEKKERLLVNEVDSNNQEIEARVAYVKDNLKRCSKLVRDTFGIEFEIKLKEGNVDAQVIQKNSDEENNV